MTLKNAITMRGTIDQCWLLALRADYDQLAAELTKPLEPVSFGGYGYLNVVVSHLSQMRPQGFPGFLGFSYWHVAYRIYARFRDIEGLAFLRSDADSPLMVWAGNLLSSFAFHQAKVVVDGAMLEVSSEEAPLRIALDRAAPVTLPNGSPFIRPEAAAEALKYKPVGLSVEGDRVDVLRITRDEAEWRSRLIQVSEASIPYLDRFAPTLEICYEVEPIEYRWNRAERFRAQA